MSRKQGNNSEILYITERIHIYGLCENDECVSMLSQNMALCLVGDVIGNDWNHFGYSPNRKKMLRKWEPLNAAA